MKKLIIFVLGLFLLTACGKTPETYRRISSEEAMKMMETEKDYIILDVRTEEEFNNGHIPNAINLANEDIYGDVSSILPKKDQLILVYCRSGSRSKQASGKLINLGYTNVIDFGGIQSWTGKIVVE